MDVFLRFGRHSGNAAPSPGGGSVGNEMPEPSAWVLEPEAVGRRCRERGERDWGAC